MRIGIIGGLDRKQRELEEIALAGGHELEVHKGVVGGTAAANGLRALVARADLVLVLTDVNSHNAVKIARREARLRQRPLRMLRRMGTSQFSAFVRELGHDGHGLQAVAAAC